MICSIPVSLVNVFRMGIYGKYKGGLINVLSHLLLTRQVPLSQLILSERHRWPLNSAACI